MIDYSANKKILIIDDEPIIQETLHALLMGMDLDFHFASSGEEGILQAQAILPDVILLDVMMPGMDGFEVCQRLKANKTTRHVPIILVTALDNPEDLSRGLDMGADEFISKPPDRREIKARVRSMLRIKQQYDELENMMKLREELSNLIVHDMRSPLNIIIGHGEMLHNNNNLPEPISLRINRINEQAEKLNKFIDEMLMIARMEQGKLHLNCTSVNVNHMILRMADEYRVIAEAKGINLVSALPPYNCYVEIDERLIGRVLDNLVGNALKYSPPQTNITLELVPVKRESKSWAQVRVRDEGIGISDLEKINIFDKFKVVELKQQGIPQVGLGLFFCKMVIETHGGNIWAEDNIPPGGTVFIFELPLEKTLPALQ
jgi:two-component system, sensor histidine kinase and response regulator